MTGIYDEFATSNGLPFPFGPIYSPTFPERFDDIDLYDQIRISKNSPELKAAATELIKITERQLTYTDFEAELTRLTDAESKNLKQGDATPFNDMVIVATQSHSLYFGNADDAATFSALVNGLQGGIGQGGNYEPMARVNWWKVLACDCIGGLVGGPGGYLGASAISVIMQL